MAWKCSLFYKIIICFYHFCYCLKKKIKIIHSPFLRNVCLELLAMPCLFSVGEEAVCTFLSSNQSVCPFCSSLSDKFLPKIHVPHFRLQPVSHISDCKCKLNTSSIMQHFVYFSTGNKCVHLSLKVVFAC